MNHVIDFRAQGTVFRFPVITKVCPVASFEDFAEENEVRAWTFELTLVRNFGSKMKQPKGRESLAHVRPSQEFAPSLC